jgi:hypothetical protein
MFPIAQIASKQLKTMQQYTFMALETLEKMNSEDSKKNRFCVLLEVNGEERFKLNGNVIVTISMTITITKTQCNN